MKRITTIFILLITLIFSCEKQELEKIPAPIGEGVIVDSSTFFELDSARDLLLCKIRHCESMQKTAGQKAKQQRERELIEALPCRPLLNE